MRKFTRLVSILSLFLIAGSMEVFAWRGAKAIVVSEPTNGGFVYVNSSNNGPSAYNQTTAEMTNEENKTGNKTFTFFRFYSAQPNYVFKGWAESASVNSGSSDQSVGISAGTAWWGNYSEKTYYAIFARMTANVNAATFASTAVGQSTQQTITITHAHAGAITATLSGTHASDFSLSSTTPVANSVSEGTQALTITFAPSCNGTRTATLTLHSNNGLNDVVINLSGEGTLNAQTLTWDNEPIDPNMILGTTRSINATATSGLSVTYTSSNPDVLSVEGNTLTANKVGSAIITATQAGDCTYSAAESITKEFTINDKAVPSFWLNNDPNQTEANLLVSNTITVAIENTTADLQISNDEALFYSLNDNMLTITAMAAAENATITLTQPETATVFAATRTFTFHITKNTATLTHHLSDGYKVDDELIITNIYAASNDEIEVVVTSDNDSVLKVEEGKLKAVGAGTATITIAQAENYKWTALSTEQTITVSKYDNHIVCRFGSETTNAKTLSYDEGTYISYSSDNTDTEHTPITITQTAGADIATFYSEQNAIYASYHNGTATWTISQPEDRKYLAAETTITVTVAPMTPNCYAVEDAAQHSIGYYENKDGIEYTLNGVGETLSVDIWKYGAALGTVVIYGYDTNNNQTTIASYNVNSDLSNDPKTMTMAIAPNIAKIKIKAEGNIAENTLNKYFKNLYITRKQLLTPSTTAVVLPDCEIGATTSATLSLDWCTCADEIKIVCDNPKFTFDKDVITTNGASGHTDILISYSSDVLEESSATVTIYTPYQQTTISVLASAIKKTQSITWDDDLTMLSVNVGTVALHAVGEGSITYASSNDDIAYVKGDTLHIVKYGTFTLTAYAEETEQYQPAYLTKDVVINALVPEIWSEPTISSITVGQSFRQAIISGGEASVEGDFTWASDEEIDIVITETGTYTVYLQFLPANANWYVTIQDIECFVTVLPNIPTNVEQSRSNYLGCKVFRNGHLYIIHNGQTYTIEGVKCF